MRDRVRLYWNEIILLKKADYIVIKQFIHKNNDNSRIERHRIIEPKIFDFSSLNFNRCVTEQNEMTDPNNNRGNEKA